MKHRSNGFNAVDYEALLDTTISIRECLPPDHLARFVVQLISQIDLNRLDLPCESLGDATHSPKTLLGLLFYSYATGVLSSNEIERATYESVALRYVAGGRRPDARTIAQFREKQLPEIQKAFVQMLVFARAAGALKLGDFHLGEFDISAAASEPGTLSCERISELENHIHLQVSELLTLARNADRAEPAYDLVMEGADTLQTHPGANLARAKALLDSYYNRHNGANNGARNGNQHVKSNGHRDLNCRECMARQQCIEATSPGPGVKLAIERKFKTGTDTHKIWSKLQQNCLLTSQPQLPEPSDAPPVTGLIRRLHQLQQSPDRIPTPEPQDAASIAGHQSTRPFVARALQDQDSMAITCVESERLVRLPREGAVVLGRFEPDQYNPPDIDLTFDDGLIPSVSRRHARITAQDGAHWIEDLSSTNGTYRNGFQLAPGERARLKAGDRILLGRCRLVYNPIAACEVGPGPSTSLIPVLTITHTGQSIGLPDKKEITIGRPDPDEAHTSDVDLSIAHDIAKHVSHLHARLVERDGQHHLERADSTADISVNGRALRTSDSPIPLFPGDQVRLGGCVLAYEWKSFEEENSAFDRILSRSMGSNGNSGRSTLTTQPTQLLSWHT
jgi:transposase